MQKKGNKYGVHRVIEPKGLMTQAAKKIDNTMECYSNEILCDVSALNIDSASFTQIYEACGKDLDRRRVTDIQEISGCGVMAQVDGIPVAAGNEKLMAQVGVQAEPCRQVGTVVHLAVDGAYAGHILVADVLKPTAKQAMADLRRAGVEQTVMLTGDRKEAARQVAREVGVEGCQPYEGSNALCVASVEDPTEE